MTAEQIDVDEVVAALGDGAPVREPSPALVDWRLRPPEGLGQVALADDGSVAAIAPATVSRAGERIAVWQLVGWNGPSVAAALSALREATPDAPWVVAGTAPPPTSWRTAARLPAWVTGPDPFVPLQREIDQLDASHDALADGIAARPELALVRDAARLTWRYLRHPEREYVVMDVPDGAVCDGIIVLEEKKIRGARSLAILEIQARGAHYALLKAARRLSWERGGIPVVLRGELMSRRYAFTAGYLPATAPLVRRPWTVHVDGPGLEGRWRSWLGDAEGA